MLLRGRGAGPSWQQPLAQPPSGLGPLPSGQEPGWTSRYARRGPKEIYPHVEDERWTAASFTRFTPRVNA